MKEPNLSCQEQLNNLQQEFDEFAYIVTHDLKAPLRAIGNLSGWIGEDLGTDLNPDVQHNIQLLQNRAERLERMINGLLLYSRSTRFELEKRVTDVSTLVQGIGNTLQQTWPFTLHTENLPTFTTYGKKLETVLEHLLQNAVKFNENPHPQVWIAAEEQENRMIFTIRDNGMGIPEDSLEKVFKIFYTVQAKDQQESVGVGLAVTKKIVQFVGGSISVTSTKGAGTEFRFSWPLAE